MASAYSLPVATGIAALFGVLSHLLYFIRGEHHTKAILMAKLLVLIPATLWVVAVHFFQLGVWHGGQFSCSLTAAYLGAMWTSMIIYRSFFHRLHHFPGPRLAKTSKLVHFLGLGRLDNFRKLTRWHQKYGNFVRIGELHVFLQLLVSLYLVLVLVLVIIVMHSSFGQSGALPTSAVFTSCRTWAPA